MTADFLPHIAVQTAPIIVADECAHLESDGTTGAATFFVGSVRGGDDGVRRMILEHYPGMTEKALQIIAADAMHRWQLSALRIVHRTGALSPGEVIVFAGVTAAHRAATFAACEFLVDYLKSRAPFWKKEITATGERWVAAHADDEAALKRWQR